MPFFISVPSILKATVSIKAGPAVTEGTAATFTITIDNAQSSDLKINLSISDTGDFVADSNLGDKTITIDAGKTSATYSVATIGDTTDEPNGSVTVTIVAGTGYNISMTNSATVTINDDDVSGRVPFARDSSQDFIGVNLPSLRGVWENGTTMWMSDSSIRQLRAYNISTKTRDSDKDFTSVNNSEGDANIYDIWSDGTTMWILEIRRDTILAYNMSTKARDASKDITLAAGNNHPVGIWSDNTTMWVSDRSDDILFAYNMSTKARDTAKEFNNLRESGNRNPTGIWSDNTTMWVGDVSDSKIYAYNMSTKARDTAKEFNNLSSFNGTALRPRGGIRSNGTTMWLALNEPSGVFAYNMPPK